MFYIKVQHDLLFQLLITDWTLIRNDITQYAAKITYI